ncbi:MAG: efflux RND transporter periplasmic adaptor subunit [Anaeromyxobacteraceae bacterium]
MAREALVRRAARAAWATPRARVLTVAVAALVLLVAWRAARAREVGAHVAAVRPLVQRVVASGRVMSPARIALAPLAPGQVLEVAVDEGDLVRPGQLLLRLDATSATAALEQARARTAEAAARLDQVRGPGARSAAELLRQAQLKVASAQAELERVRKLYDAGAASAQARDDAQRALDVARSAQDAAAAQAASAAEGADQRAAAAALRGAQAAEEVARAALEDRALRAPAAGRVLLRDVEPGDVVGTGKTVLVLSREGETRLTVQPDEKSLAVLALGQGASAVADAYPAAPFEAKVTFIAPSVDPARGTVEVRLAVPRPPAFLRPEMTVSVNVEVGRKAEALVVPAEVVRDAAASPWVLTIAGGRAERRPVTLGLRGEGYVEVTAGLAPGDAVIPSSSGRVEPGERVRASALAPPAGFARAL